MKMGESPEGARGRNLGGNSREVRNSRLGLEGKRGGPEDVNFEGSIG